MALHELVTKVYYLQATFLSKLLVARDSRHYFERRSFLAPFPAPRLAARQTSPPVKHIEAP